MKEVDAATTAAWQDAFKGGTTRPMQRATIQKLTIGLYPYDFAGRGMTPYTDAKTRSGNLASAMFGQDHVPVELPNIKSIRWTRSIDSDAATCILVLWNSEIVPLGETPTGADTQTIGRPGYFTFNRGATTESNALWGYNPNGWQDLIVPDRVIRTYEGYGFDANEIPENDPNMYPSGLWIIDDVDFTADGLITVTCRDFGRLLMDQIMFPPVVPWAYYPLFFEPYKYVDNPDKVVTTETDKWFTPLYETDSNIPYIGKGFTDGPRAYVDGNGGVLGHYGKHAFDSSASTYWLSVGNNPTWSSAYEFVQGHFSSRPVSAVRFKAWGGPYRYYISVFAEGYWRGTATIPYRSRAVDTNADIRFVASGRVGKNQDITVKLPKDFPAATKIRITFSDLYDSGIGEYQYRAGCYDVAVYGSTTSSKTVDGGQHLEGNYGDYTDIVKILLGWGGFFWPDGAYVTLSDGSQVAVTPPTSDPVMPFGRIWGDFELTGTAGKVTLDIPIWDKKPLMDGVSYVRDVIGFIFYIDESGAAVWRSPNIWSIGNWVWGQARRSADYVLIDEAETLNSLNVKLSSRNVRDRVFVSNLDGKTGAVAAGYNPFPSNIRRVAGWTDQNFETLPECQVMADLITVRQAFKYRMDTLVIPGNPSIQIDDQIKILERTSNETYYHYVREITSEWDAQTGKWTYSIGTHWLGESPFDRWAFDPAALSADTRNYLALIGSEAAYSAAKPPTITDSGGPYQPPPSTSYPTPVPGVIKYGSSGGPAGAASVDSMFGGLDVYRAFDSGFPATWSASNGSDVDDTAANIVIHSMKPNVASAANGSLNTALHTFVASIPDDGKTHYLCLWHEPEDNVEEQLYTAAQWRQMWTNYKSIIATVRTEQSRTDLFSMQILMTWSLDPKSGRNAEDYYAATDVLGWDSYTPEHLAMAERYSRSKGKSYWMCEYALHDPQSYTDSAYANGLARDFASWSSFTQPPMGVCYFEATVGGDYRLANSNRVQSRAVWASLCSTGALP